MSDVDIELTSELTDDVAEELKAKYHDVYQLDALGKTIVVRPPDETTWKRFLDYGADDDRRSIAMRKLVEDTVVWPAKHEFQAMMKRQPGLYLSFGGEVARIAGMTRAVEQKKL